jgi:hypothetical protein
MNKKNELEYMTLEEAMIEVLEETKQPTLNRKQRRLLLQDLKRQERRRKREIVRYANELVTKHGRMISVEQINALTKKIYGGNEE